MCKMSFIYSWEGNVFMVDLRNRTEDNYLNQGIEFFDNDEMKKRCPECKRELIHDKCKFCGITIENGN